MQEITLYILMLFTLPSKDFNEPKINVEFNTTSFTTKEACKAHLEKQKLEELMLYRFIDRQGAFGFYMCVEHPAKLMPKNEKTI